MGTTATLTAVVAALCKKVASVFAAHGVPLPPWRHEDAVLSKWMPRAGEERSWFEDDFVEVRRNIVCIRQAIAGAVYLLPYYQHDSVTAVWRP